jgi:hypothetical protein
LPREVWGAIEKESKEKMRLSLHFKTILIEDKKLLKKLTK